MDALAASRSAALPPPLPILPDDLLVEILLRLPPEPIYLRRASLVSKHFRGVVDDAGFLHRFREFHGGTPPVFGFFNNQPGPPLFVHTADASTASAAATMSHEDWWTLDCRHGLALLENRRSSELLVWDLVTGGACLLPMPPAPDCRGVFNGAVLRAAGPGDRHSRCPFLVVYVCSPSNYMSSACVYSETGIWSELTSIAMPYLAVEVKPTALVGNRLYWLFDNSSILEFDLDNHRLGLTEMISYDALASYEGEIIIMPTEDGLLGLAGVEGFNLHLWSMVKSIDDGVVGTTWTRQRVIDLRKLIAPQVLATCTVGVEPIGFAEDAGVIFIYVQPSVYMIHLKSMQIVEVSEKGHYGSIFPYASFYSPGITICGGDDQAELLNRCSDDCMVIR